MMGNLMMDIKKITRKSLSFSLGFVIIYGGIDFLSKKVSLPYENYKWSNRFTQLFEDPMMLQNSFGGKLFSGEFKSLTYEFDHISEDTFLLIYNVRGIDESGNAFTEKMVLPRYVGYLEHYFYIFDAELFIESSTKRVVKPSPNLKGLEAHINSLLREAHREIGSK